jgi:hypothetical protein
MDAVLEFLNSKIREEHGNRVDIDSKWIDAEVDSFGTTMVFLEMEEKYNCFDKEWFNAHQGKWETLTIREVVERVMNESTKL